MKRAPFLLLLAALSTAGCGRAVQDYTVVPPSSGSADLADSQVVVEGRVTRSRSYDTATFADYVFFFVPHGPSIANRRSDLVITVDRVLRGDSGGKTVEIYDYRPLAPHEFELFPGGFGMFHQPLFVRLGYDRRHGKRLKAMRIVPLRTTPEFEAAMLRTRQLRSQTLPTSRRSN